MENLWFLQKIQISSSRMSDGRSSRRNFIEQRLSKRDSQMNETSEMIVAPNSKVKSKKPKKIIRKRKKKRSLLIQNNKSRLSLKSNDIGLTNDEVSSTERKQKERHANPNECSADHAMIRNIVSPHITNTYVLPFQDETPATLQKNETYDEESKFESIKQHRKHMLKTKTHLLQKKGFLK